MRYFIPFLAMAIAYPLSFGLLRLYRHAVLKSMSARANERATEPILLESSTPPDNPVRTAPDLSVLDHASSIAAKPPEEILYSNLRRRPWRTATIYVAAGICYALVITAAQLMSIKAEFLPLRFLVLFWVYAWPVVLTISLVALVTQRAKFATTSIYFFGLVAISAIAILMSPKSGWGQLAFLWLVTNIPPTILLLTFLNRRVQAVGPLVLTFMVIAFTGSWLALSIVPGDEKLLPFIVLGFAVFGLAGWLALQWIKWRYEQKKISDQSSTLDAIWLLSGVMASLELSYEGTVWTLSGLLAFATYKVVAWAGFSLLSRESCPTQKSPKLLLLRVFSLGKRSERLFDALAKYWRHVGSICLIAGPDLATATVEPNELLQFLRRKLARRFIDGPQTLDLQISQMDLESDPDGRFRVNEYFCYNDIWRIVLTRLVGDSDAVLMDLRGFSSQNDGCVFEIEELINLVALEKVMFVIDDTTDERFLHQTIEESWDRMRSSSPNCSSTSGQLRLFRFAGSRGAELRRLLRALCSAVSPRVSSPRS